MTGKGENMNKRQKKKYDKKVWKEALSRFAYEQCGIYIKPSRMRLHISKIGKEYHFIGTGAGYEFDLTGVEKE